MIQQRRFAACPLAAFALSVTVTVAAGSLAAAAPAEKKTIGFVLSSLYTAIHETPYMDECPEGLAIGTDELWLAPKSREERDNLTGGGTINHTDRRLVAAYRGPNGEETCWNPELFKDPPLRTVQSKVSLGFNLDGDTKGEATPKTCAHENFASLDGEPGIDNQVYRVLGCIKGFRKDGFVENAAQLERVNMSQGIWLVEIGDVDDMANDSDVRVAFYQPADMLIKDAAGKVLPYASYMITKGRYGVTTKGRIVGGVLETDPVDAHLPFRGNLIVSELNLRDMRLKVELSADGSGAKGLLGGYTAWETWWDFFRKIGLASTSTHSCPAVYEASRRLADGYPDPETGRCTALSTAYTIELSPAFIVHSDEHKEAAAELDTARRN